MPTPPEELIKDTFAEFGLTYYESESLCQGLGVFYALMSFKDISDMTRPRLEEKLVETASLTLGVVIGKVQPLVSSDLQTRLDHALAKRNYLAHQFWYDHAYDMQNASGLKKLIIELRQSRQIFEELDTEISKLTVQRRLELTDKAIEEQSQKGLEGELEHPLPTKSPLSRRMVRVVEVYDVAFEDGSSTLVFITDDNQFLQLCDVGLGWSNFREIGSNWTINSLLKQYLPASIVPRPEITDSWNYEFVLPKNSFLWVRRSSTDKMFKWGIRPIKK